MAVTIGTVTTTYHAGSFPTSGTFTANTTGAEALLVMMYLNVPLAGPDVTLWIVDGSTNIYLYPLDVYNNTTAGFGQVRTFIGWKNLNLPEGVVTINYAQGTSTSNSERLFVCVPLSGLNGTVPMPNVRRGYSNNGVGTASATFGEEELSTPDDFAISASFHYYPTNAPTKTNAATSLLFSNTANASIKAIGQYSQMSAGNTPSHTYGIDAFNYNTTVSYTFTPPGDSGRLVQKSYSNPNLTGQYANAKGLWYFDTDETPWLNLVTPGTGDLTKVGGTPVIGLGLADLQGAWYPEAGTVYFLTYMSELGIEGNTPWTVFARCKPQPVGFSDGTDRTLFNLGDPSAGQTGIEVSTYGTIWETYTNGAWIDHGNRASTDVQTVCLTYDGAGTCRFYNNGVLRNTFSRTVTLSAQDLLSFGIGQGPWYEAIYEVGIVAARWSDAEAAEYDLNPLGIVTPAEPEPLPDGGTITPSNAAVVATAGSPVLTQTWVPTATIAYAESTATQGLAVGSFGDLCTLSFLPNASKTYMLIATGVQTTTATDTSPTLFQIVDGSNTVLSLTSKVPGTTGQTDSMAASAFYTSGASPTTVTFKVQGQTPSSASVAGVRFTAIEVRPGLDAFAQNNTTVTTASTSTTNGISITAPQAGEYLVVAMAVAGANATTTFWTLQANDGASFGAQTSLGDGVLGVRNVWGTAMKRTLTAGQTVRIQYQRAAGTGTVSVYQQRLMLIHLPSWVRQSTNSNSSLATLSGTANTYIDLISAPSVTSPGTGPVVTFWGGTAQTSAGTLITARFGLHTSANVLLGQAATALIPSSTRRTSVFQMYQQAAAAGTVAQKLRGARTATANTYTADETFIAVLEPAYVLTAAAPISVTPNNAAVAVSSTSPTATQSAGTINLTPNASAVVVTASSPTRTQVHNVTPAASSVAVTASSPTRTQVHNVVANALLGTSAMTSPAVTLSSSVAPSSQTGATTATSPALTQIHSLAASAAVVSVAASSPTRTQVHNVTAANAAVSVTASSPTRTQVHNVSPAGQTGTVAASQPSLSQAGSLAVNPALGVVAASSPVLTQAHGATANAATASGAITQAVLTQVHSLAPSSQSGTTAASQPSLSQAGSLAVNPLVGTGTATSPAITQAHQTAASAASVAGTISRPVATQAHTVAVSPLAGTGTIQQAGLTQNHLLVPQSQTAVTAASQASLGQAGQLSGTTSQVGVTASSPWLSQIHATAPQSLVGASAITSPIGTQNHVLAAANLLVAAQASQASLGQAGELSPSVATVSSIAGTPVLTQAHVISGSAAQVGGTATPVAMTQAHSVVPAGLRVVSTTPLAALQQNHLLSGQSQSGTTAITPTSLSQNHRLVAAAALVAGSLTPAAFSQAHSLIARGVNVATAISLAALVQNHNLTPDDLAVLVNLEPAQFLTGLRDGTIRVVDETWIVVEVPGQPVRIRRAVSVNAIPMNTGGGSQRASMPVSGGQRVGIPQTGSQRVSLTTGTAQRINLG